MQKELISDETQDSSAILCFLLASLNKKLGVFFYLALSALPLLSPSFAYSQSKEFSHQDLDIKIGQAVFEKLWVFSPSSTKSSDGLGPLYNARSCHQCHDESKLSKHQPPSSLVIQLSIEPSIKETDTKVARDYLKYYGFIPEPTYGKQIQTFASPGAPSEATIESNTYKRVIEFEDGESVTLSHVDYQLTQPAYGKFHIDTRISARVAPRMLGLGLLDQISAFDIKQLADPEDIDNDGISGKINTVWSLETNNYALGKFGWKATKPSLNQQNLAALSTDIGVSSWLFPNPQGDCTKVQHKCVNLAETTETHIYNTSGPEASRDMTDLLFAFTQIMNKKFDLASPKPLTASQKHGQELFSTIQCAHCHQPSFNINHTNESGNITSSQISPYSDLLLHNMGQDLSDNRKEYQATGLEWRTAPLWGIRAYLAQTQAPHFLHDGRASTITEAILWHGGEAEQSKQLFMRLPKYQRTQLIDFVESL